MGPGVGPLFSEQAQVDFGPEADIRSAARHLRFRAIGLRATGLHGQCHGDFMNTGLTAFGRVRFFRL